MRYTRTTDTASVKFWNSMFHYISDDNAMDYLHDLHNSSRFIAYSMKHDVSLASYTLELYYDTQQYITIHTVTPGDSWITILIITPPLQSLRHHATLSIIHHVIRSRGMSYVTWPEADTAVLQWLRVSRRQLWRYIRVSPSCLI